MDSAIVLQNNGDGSFSQIAASQLSPSDLSLVSTWRTKVGSLKIGDFNHDGKRPQRTGYSGEDKDPCEQVYAYIEDILAGKVIGEDKQHVQVSDKTRFYCYILADLTPQLRKLAKRNEFFDTTDGLGTTNSVSTTTHTLR